MRVPVYGPGRSNDQVVGYALVDMDDYEALSRYVWRLDKDGYVRRRSNGRDIYMHRHVLGLVPGDGWCTDHINRNKLDNRRLNLRRVTRQQNAQNRGPLPKKGDSSPYRGVFWDKRRGKWIACSHLNKRRYTLGAYDDEQQAARVASEWRAVNMPFSVEARVGGSNV